MSSTVTVDKKTGQILWLDSMDLENLTIAPLKPEPELTVNSEPYVICNEVRIPTCEFDVSHLDIIYLQQRERRQQLLSYFNQDLIRIILQHLYYHVTL
jgi:hypothetical protein